MEFKLTVSRHIKLTSLYLQDGMICLWDLLTGACAYSILAHDGEVAALAHSPSYVISLGLADAKICVWERFQGHHINTIQLVSMTSGDSEYRVTMVVRC